MKNITKAFFLFAILISGSSIQAQGFWDDGTERPCPPPSWCETPLEVGGSNAETDAADAIGDALEDPEGCVGACALGKWFSDVIRPFYPDCYPNCNLAGSEPDETQPEEPTEPTPSQPEVPDSTTSQIFNTDAYALSFGQNDKGYSWLTKTFSRAQAGDRLSSFDKKYMNGGHLKIMSQYHINKGKDNEFRAFVCHVRGKKSGLYDIVYIYYSGKRTIILNQAYAKKKLNYKTKSKRSKRKKR